MRRNKTGILITAMIVCMVFLFSNSVEASDFIKTFVIRIGGVPILSGDEVKAAKHDIIFARKVHYRDYDGVSEDLWGDIKAINPNAQIYLYVTHLVNINTDELPTVYLENLGRYNVSRGHSMGSLNGDHPEFFLTDAEGNRITKTSNPNYYLLDFGDSGFHDYAVETTKTDFINHTWTADGVFSDHAWCLLSGDNSSTPEKYNTNTKWSTAMNSMLNRMTAELHLEGQNFAGNRGFSRLADGYNSWLDLDSSLNPPDVVMEESAFAVPYGFGDIQFFPEEQWKRQVDILGLIKNSKICFKSGTDLQPGQSGFDNNGSSFSFWDGLWYAMGSYLLGKEENGNQAYFLFVKGSDSTIDLDVYYDEYDRIDLGRPVSTYAISQVNGGTKNIYWREFEFGYVYVNPTLSDVSSISLPETCKQRTHDNLYDDIQTLPDINEISLKSHRTAILIKSVADRCRGDLDIDGDVDGRDLFVFQTTPEPGLDTEEFASKFGAICPTL